MKLFSIRDDVDLRRRIVLWVLVTLGIESIFYYGHWWLDPRHRVNPVFYAILTFAIFWGLWRSLINWYHFLFIKGTAHRPAPTGLRVDVFTTAMPGEPFAMFEKTLEAIAAIRYPHQSYLLDGGNDSQLRELCQRLGIRHLDCRGVRGAKAGKINHALGCSEGDFVLVIDPDHIPERGFLDQVLGHFDNPQVGYVQVVQAYYNQSESYISRAGAEQTYGFYGPTMMGMNGLGTTVAIGANCTFRRKALESIGGHAVDLVEDYLTAMRLHASGWKSVYVPKRLSFGLVPEDLHSYFKQQLKWSTGVFNVLFREYPRYAGRLPFFHKIGYFFSGTYFFEGIPTAITCILPILFLFFGLWAVEMDLKGFLLHAAPYSALSTFIGLYSQKWYRDSSEQGLLWRGMFLKKGTWPIYVLSFLYLLSRTRVPYFPTPKTKEQGVFTKLVVPHMAVIVLSAGGILYSLLQGDTVAAGTGIMIFFAISNILLMLPTVVIAHAGLFRRS